MFWELISKDKKVTKRYILTRQILKRINSEVEPSIIEMGGGNVRIPCDDILCYDDDDMYNIVFEGGKFKKVPFTKKEVAEAKRYNDKAYLKDISSLRVSKTPEKEYKNSTLKV